MQSGVYWGYVGLVEGIVRQITARTRPPDEGDRNRRAGRPVRAGNRCYSTAIEDDLTMHGLVLIHRFNKELETA